VKISQLTIIGNAVVKQADPLHGLYLPPFLVDSNLVCNVPSTVWFLSQKQDAVHFGVDSQSTKLRLYLLLSSVGFIAC